MKMKLVKGQTNVFECGCTTGQHYEAKTFYISLCNLHAHAEKLREMLKTVHREGAGLHYEAIAELLAKSTPRGKP